MIKLTRIGNIGLRDTGARLNARNSTTPVYRQALLYSAFSATMLILIIGILTLLWLWQVKDLGVSVDWTGRILHVQPNSSAAQAGVLPGDSVSFEDFERIKRTSGQAHTGQTLQIEVWHGSQPRNVTLEVTPLAVPRRISLCIEAIIGLGFVLLGTTPLFARRRTSSLWLFFASSLLVGLFLITDGPRGLLLPWAEAVTYITLPLFPAVLFHFHTVFPKPTLGRYRRSLVTAVYLLAAILLPFDLISLKDYSFYLSDGWQTVLDLYIALVLLACLAMILHTFLSTRDPKVRAQLKTVTLSSAVGLSINAVLILPHVLLDLEANDALKNLSVMSALTVPFGYSYSIWRHNLLIDGLLWRRWLVRVVSSSVLLLAWLAGVLSLLGNELTTAGAILSTWWSVVLSAVLVVVVNEKLWELLERLLFKGSSYMELLASTTDALQRARNLEEYIHFFSEQLPNRLKIVGSLIFLSAERGDPLVMRGCSPSLHMPTSKSRSRSSEDALTILPGSELRPLLQGAHTPVPLSTLLGPHTAPFPARDAHLLEVLKLARIEVLLPLVSSHQQLIGLVALGAKETDEAYSTQELTALSTLSRAASLSAENVLRIAELEQEREYSAALARSVSASQEQERKRISRDLHDSTLQELGTISRALSEMREQVQEMIATCEAQEIEVELYDHDGDGFGLGTNVTSITDMTNMTSINNTNSMNTESILSLAHKRSQLKVLLNEWQTRLGVLLGEDIRLVGSLQSGVSATPSMPSLPLQPYTEMKWDPLALASQPTIEGLIGQVRATSRRVREICNDLHPSYLDAALQVTLKDSVAQLRKLNPDVSIEIDSSGEEPSELPDDAKVACKELMEQAIRNALAHAKPSHIRVSLSFPLEEAIALSVADNGTGFEPRLSRELRSAGHHGLANMMERAELAGGELQITSAPGEGALIRLYIPPQPSRT